MKPWNSNALRLLTQTNKWWNLFMYSNLSQISPFKIGYGPQIRRRSGSIQSIPIHCNGLGPMVRSHATETRPAVECENADQTCQTLDRGPVRSDRRDVYGHPKPLNDTRLLCFRQCCREYFIFSFWNDENSPSYPILFSTMLQRYLHWVFAIAIKWWRWWWVSAGP